MMMTQFIFIFILMDGMLIYRTQFILILFLPSPHLLYLLYKSVILPFPTPFSTNDTNSYAFVKETSCSLIRCVNPFCPPPSYWNLSSIKCPIRSLICAMHVNGSCTTSIIRADIMMTIGYARSAWIRMEEFMPRNMLYRRRKKAVACDIRTSFILVWLFVWV